MRTIANVEIGVLALIGALAAASPAAAQETLLEVDSGGDYYGRFYAGVDFDGDEVPDLLIIPGGRDRVWLLSGADGSQIKEFTDLGGTLRTAQFVPDIDEDGVPDVVVAISRGSRNDAPAGQIHMISGVDGSNIWTATGNNASEAVGQELSLLGDVTGDGVPDLLAGGWNVARCLSGADGSRIYEYSSTGSCCPSEQITRAGDLDGDGVEDFLVGQVRYSGEFFGASFPEGAGRALIVSGKDGQVIREHRGKATFALVGLGVASLGDIDGDQVADYVVSANILKGSAFNPGFTLYSGRRGKKIVAVQTLRIPGLIRLDPRPESPGDVDRDGFQDMLVTGLTKDDVSFVGIVSGRPSENPLLFRYDTPENDFFTSVGVAGDIDRDGVSDLVVGLSEADVVRVVRVRVPPMIPSKVKNALAFARQTGVEEEISARLSVVVKKGVQSFTISTSGLAVAKSGDGAKAATGPFGVFLEDGLDAGTFTSIGSLDASGAYSVSGTGTVPPELGVTSLADVVGRRVQLRDGGGSTLLETFVPPLAKQKKGKATGSLTPVSAEFPKAKLKLKAVFNPKTGALDVKAKVKKAGDGPFVFELETSAGSGVYEEIARVEGSKLILSTATGAPLAGAFTVADLIGRGVRVYSGATLVLEGRL